MATYKVPQDVEADDKLIGPFSFRQFIYLIIVALAIALAWGLSSIFVGLAIIPLPVILLFGALALPLRKDQPMEIYLAAMISFLLKPHTRLWDPDGVDTLIEITVPKVVEVQRTKNISQADAQQRFSYLANIVDSGGWAIRGADVRAPQNGAINNDVFLEAQGAQDVLDENNSVAQNFNTMMTEKTSRARQEAMDRMRQPAPMPPAPVTPPMPQVTPAQAPTVNPATAYAIPEPATQQFSAPSVQPVPDTGVIPVFNPYPTIQQTVIQPINNPSHESIHTETPLVDPISTTPEPETPTTTSDKPTSADIINLANNPDLSIETIAREAHRIQAKENDMSEEVVISLR